ncbi:MAG: VWA domain-containing protein [Planctomycetia bacterium]|nr:VWA domain-containing protein [Planctomycetia bacterium]
MIEYADPIYFLLLVLIPVLILWYWKFGKKQEGTIQFSSTKLLGNHFKKRGHWRTILMQFILMSMLVFTILGLTRPRLVDTLDETKIEVVDIILVLDISSSMLAEDFKPNRLEAVKKTAKTFVDNRKGDRIGLLVFAGETFIQCPLTIDTDVLTNLLKDVSVAEKEYDGTAIGMAIANATNRLRNSDAKSKIMILLSDGSNNAGELDPMTAAEMASEFGIKIYTIGAGTNQSVTYIPNRGYIRNEVDEETLKAIAKQTNGQYFRANNIGRLERIYEEIDKLERSEIEVKTYSRYQDLYGWLLIPAAILGLWYEALNRSIFRRKM